ncbi:MAG TPA: ribosome-associated translation inhibitor RaiA [Fibrobacteraceae bacterium]|nr:ribosome-associated translation inhibitor RaiA [Fibrobacteraceae bacterium]
MNIKVTARHFNASESLQGKVQEEAERLQKFYPAITDVTVILDAERKNTRRAEFIVGILHHTVAAVGEEENMGKALDSAIERVERQLKKENEKLKSHKAQPTASVVD